MAWGSLDLMENKVVTKCSEKQNVSSRTETFGVKDNKGREIGARVTIFEIEFVALNHELAEFERYSPNPSGRVFSYDPTALRNGRPFGAGFQHGGYFATAAERDAAVEKYFKGARKRAEKTAGKV